MKKRIINKVIYFLSFCVIALPAYSQTKPITLNECLQMGMKASEAINISNSKVMAAEARQNESEAAMLPTVKLIGSYTRLSDIDPFRFGNVTVPVLLNNINSRLTVNQPIFAGMRLRNVAKFSEYNLKAAESDYKKDKLQLVYDLKFTYWTLYKGMQILQSLNENINQIHAHLDDLTKLAKAGLATENDILKVKVQVSNLEYSKIEAESNVELAMMSLNNLLGLPIATKLELKDSVSESRVEDVNMNNLLVEALNQRPEIKSMEYRVKAGKTAVDIANAGWYPQIFLSANYLYANPNQRVFMSQGEFKGTWDVGLSISYDIWNWLTPKYQAQQAEETYVQTQLGMDQLKEAVQLDVSQSYFNIMKAKEKLPVAKTGIQQAEENFRVTRERFKSGLATNTDVLDAETALINARINYAAALVDIEIAKAKLERSIGNN